MLLSGARRASIFACLAVMLQLLAAPLIVRCVDTHGIARLEVGCARDVGGCDHACDASDSDDQPPSHGPCEDTPAQTLLARANPHHQVGTELTPAAPTYPIAHLQATFEPQLINLPSRLLPPRRQPPPTARTALRTIVLQV